jgi:hypothetical protein
MKIKLFILGYPIILRVSTFRIVSIIIAKVVGPEMSIFTNFLHCAAFILKNYLYRKLMINVNYKNCYHFNIKPINSG